MWVALAFVGFAVVMIVGPIMMMRPTHAQKRMAEIRRLAQEKGMRVQLLPLPSASEKSNSPRALPYYSLPWSSDKIKPFDEMYLLRKSFTHEAHFCGEWDWLNSAKAGKLSNASLSQLQQLLASAPKEFLGLGILPHGVGCYWNERISGKNLQEGLSELHEFLVRLNEIVIADLQVINVKNPEQI